VIQAAQCAEQTTSGRLGTHRVFPAAIVPYYRNSGVMRSIIVPVLLPESGVKTPISGFEKSQPVKLFEHVSG
jgi:hypothetical protein